MDEFAYDEDVFAQINLDIKLTKNKYYGILSCSRCFPERLEWNSGLITDHINIKTQVQRVVEVAKLVDALPKYHPEKLYVIHFECDTRCYSARDIHPPHLEHVKKILDEVTSNMDKIWKSNTNLLFLLSHPMYKEAKETRFFNWLYRHSPNHCYRLYGVHKPKAT